MHGGAHLQLITKLINGEADGHDYTFSDAGITYSDATGDDLQKARRFDRGQRDRFGRKTRVYDLGPAAKNLVVSRGS